ncbi:hypothetical protein Sjap_018806 [Stephania japonica]|uniref:Uncharacterized protein n=1 Tax=Stephania japonica TaxID=461633 RepID=A0AAP0I9F9_9MAGN
MGGWKDIDLRHCFANHNDAVKHPIVELNALEDIGDFVLPGIFSGLPVVKMVRESDHRSDVDQEEGIFSGLPVVKMAQESDHRSDVDQEEGIFSGLPVVKMAQESDHRSDVDQEEGIFSGLTVVKMAQESNHRSDVDQEEVYFCSLGHYLNDSLFDWSCVAKAWWLK